MWTIEVAGSDRRYTLYEDKHGRTKYLKQITALNLFRKIKLEPGHRKRLLLDGVAVRTHVR